MLLLFASYSLLFFLSFLPLFSSPPSFIFYPLLYAIDLYLFSLYTTSTPLFNYSTSFFSILLLFFIYGKRLKRERGKLSQHPRVNDVGFASLAWSDHNNGRCMHSNLITNLSTRHVHLWSRASHLAKSMDDIKFKSSNHHPSQSKHRAKNRKKVKNEKLRREKEKYKMAGGFQPF